MANERLPVQGEPAIEAVLEKLDPDDREVVRGALERAEKTEAELRHLADHDSLTGLLDRRRFRSELDQYVSFSARYGGQGAVMIIDIDGLKGVNDSLGHHAGDNLIRQIAGILRERVRTTDIVARLSGDEFAVLMPQTETEGALQLGEDLRAQVAECARPTPETDPVTISVGITMFGGDQDRLRVGVALATEHRDPDADRRRAGLRGRRKALGDLRAQLLAEL
ncbi:MAG TPA: GGDEF domain-containing protein, partial [Solirubrobacterales bacterium]|nr:GGDEF domain-containing protein [Solirubrobacterales bacterium]